MKIGEILRDIARCCPTLLLAASGGWLLSLVHVPLAWFFGALFAVAGINLIGVRMRGPRGFRQLGQIFIGSTIGLYFTPIVAGIVLAHLPWMLVVALVSIGFGGVGALIVGRLAGLDRATAFFGNVPGGMVEMLEIGDRYGASAVPLTLSQLTRVTIVVLSMPPALTILGQTGTEIFIPLARNINLPLLTVLILVASAAACLLHRLGMPNSWMLGSAFVTALPTLFEIEISIMPVELLNVAQVLIGIALGERFSRQAMASAPKVIIGSAFTTLVMMIAAVVLALFIAGQTGIVPAALIAATAPGGLAEMSLTAAVLKLGVPLVTAYHIVRVILITLLTLPLYQLGLVMFPIKPGEKA